MIHNYNISKYLTDKLVVLGINQTIASITTIIALLILIFLLSVAANYIAKKLILSVLKSFVRKSKTIWDDILLEKKVFNRLSHFAPAIVIHYLIGIALEGYPGWIELIKNGTYIYMIAVTGLVLDSFLSALNEIYNTLPISKTRSIKSYTQVAKIVIYFIIAIVVIAVLLNKNVGTLFAGLGAFAAVLMLIFQDSIKGLVSGVQLSANDMVRPGDWISMPKYNTDGTVLEITLNTVKVQNWDKTISTIPTHALVQDSFSNWRGMEESGGRRIARSVNIDITSIKFCSPEMIEKFKKVEVLKEYIDSKLKDVENHNKTKAIDDNDVINGRRLTNIGTFRIYLERYLRNHPLIKKDLTLLVRQLAPEEKGVPIQIYCFTSKQAWIEYEAVQGDIFDHILSVIPEFELKVFQNPSGADFKALGSKNN